MQSSPGRPEDTRGEPEGGRRRLQQTALPCITPEEGEPGRGDSTGKGPGGSLLGMLMVRQERNKPGGETGCGVTGGQRCSTSQARKIETSGFYLKEDEKLWDVLNAGSHMICTVRE